MISALNFAARNVAQGNASFERFEKSIGTRIFLILKGGGLPVPLRVAPAGTGSSGHAAWRTTCSAVLPRRTRLAPVYPWVAMTIKSAPCTRTRLVISWNGLPVRTYEVTATSPLTLRLASVSRFLRASAITSESPRTNMTNATPDSHEGGSMTCTRVTAAPSVSASAPPYRTPDRHAPEKSVGARIFRMLGGIVIVATWRRAIPDLFEGFIFIVIVSRGCLASGVVSISNAPPRDSLPVQLPRHGRDLDLSSPRRVEFEILIS